MGQDGDEHLGGLLGRDCWGHKRVSVRQTQPGLEAAGRKQVVRDFEPGVRLFNQSCQGGLMRFQLKFLLRWVSPWGDKPQSWRALRTSGSRQLCQAHWHRWDNVVLLAPHSRPVITTKEVALPSLTFPTRGPREGARGRGDPAVHRTRARLFWP